MEQLVPFDDSTDAPATDAPATDAPATDAPAAGDPTAGERGHGRRAMLRRLAAAGAGVAAGSALVAARADAADGGNLVIGTDNAGTTPTVLTYTPPATPAFPDSGSSLLTSAEKKPGSTATDALAIFPAALGGYGIANIKHGVHGSTRSVSGFGVVAANAAPPAAQQPAPRALAVGAFGAHIQFLPPGAVALATGVSDAPEVIGPSAGVHGPGELYVDDAYNLWYSVPAGTTPAAGVAWIRLAGAETAGSFVTLASPVRIYDSRSNQGPASTGAGPISGGQERTISLLQGFIGTSTTKVDAVPVAAMAAAINLTVTNTTGAGNIAVFSADVANPGTSNINWSAANQDIANFAISATGVKGDVKLHAGGGGTADIVLDVTGYYL